jgi:DNA-binding MarR family transcriptional regulator
MLDTVPITMRVIREQMRRHRSGVTIVQFRALCFVSMTSDSSLSAVADFIGLSLPAMSRLVDGLVEKRLMKRRASDNDRRHLQLSVTAAGEAALREAREMAQAHLTEKLSALTAPQRAAVASVMQLLRGVFGPEAAADAAVVR